jgi:two-component system, response regulator
MVRHKAVSILLVEDNPDHAHLTIRALRDGDLLNDIHWVKDGAEALDYLYRRGRYADPATAPRPGLILLDIKLPKQDGHDVLRRIKSDEELRVIPVVMLTTSTRDDEVSAAYQTGANSFVAKPVNFTEFMEKVRTVKLYWILTNVLTDPASRSESANR